MSAATRYRDFIRVGGIRYRLGSPVRWYLGAKNSPWWLDMDGSEEFDSSVPRLLWWLVSPHHERWLLPAKVHDTLLQTTDPEFAAAEWYRCAKACDPGNPLNWWGYKGIQMVTVQ